MKNIFVLVGMMMVSWGMVCCAAQEQELFLQAAVAYEKGDWGKAYALYESMPEKNCAVWYNMANAAYKLGNHQEALLLWRKAERNAGSKQLGYIHHNMGVAYRALSDQQVAQWRYSWIDAVRSIGLDVPLVVWQLLFLLLVYSLLGVVIVFGNPHRLYTALIAALLIALASLLFARYVHGSALIGLVKKEDVQLYAGPDKQYQPITPLAKMHEVEILQQHESWCKIRAGTMQGWVPADCLELV